MFLQEIKKINKKDIHKLDMHYENKIRNDALNKTVR